ADPLTRPFRARLRLEVVQPDLLRALARLLLGVFLSHRRPPPGARRRAAAPATAASPSAPPICRSAPAPEPSAWLSGRDSSRRSSEPGKSSRRSRGLLSSSLVLRGGILGLSLLSGRSGLLHRDLGHRGLSSGR